MAQKCPSCDYPYVPSGSKVKCPNCGKEISVGCFSNVIVLILIIVGVVHFCEDKSSSDTTSQRNIADNSQNQQPPNILNHQKNQEDLSAVETVKSSEKLPSEESQNSYYRDPRDKDVANVFYNPSYSLYDLLTDELILPNKEAIYDIYYTSNEDPTPKKFVGNANELSNLMFYKFSNFENCKKWCDEHNPL
jgi:hypothetical protein